ncbi:MAG: DUF2357 domain-containing protein [Clostridia bacterium]|nr:DUF2357 domain-containing protein [Clostridia bacterium]
MSNEKVSELYGEYQLMMKSLVEGDDYYQHLMEAISAGNNSFSLFNRYFEKKIDLRWVDAIEACIIPLDTIIRNPRKFIVQEEEIVPIERARKITAESVRHLAQHTSMIARVEGDRVTPSKILNVFREESFEIYENRFIFTLLKNLQRFVDQRYDVLFSLDSDESMASLKMSSEIENGREQIKYNLEISTKSCDEHSDGEIKDTKDATAFERIERIKRIVNEFAHSSFMRDLQGCTPVRPPIMRTNVISKDVNFRACLELWQFISAYNEVGYEIIAKETDEMVSDEYRDDLFRIFTTNYLLLKNNTVEEENIQGKIRKRRVKPKMLKRLAEELVLNYDMEEVEIRKVFVDELKRVSKKKIAGEQKIRDAITRALDAENARKAEIEAKRLAEIQRQKEIEKRRKQMEAARIAREKQKEKERIAREKAREKARREREKAAELAAKEKERLRLQKEKERKERELAALQAKKEKERLAKQAAIARQKEKERLAKEKQKEKDRLAREKAAQLAKEKAAAIKQKEKERQAKAKAAQAEKDRIALEKQKEKERLAREKQKEKERLAREAQKEKDRLAREKQKEKERLAREKAAQIAKEKAAAARLKEKERQEKAKAALKEKERIAREKQKEKERLAREKLKEKERLAKQKAAQNSKAKAAAAKKAAAPYPEEE